MEKIKHVALLLLVTVIVFGCSKYDDTELKNGVRDLYLKSRIEKLELWCNMTNGQISALQGLVSVLEEKDFVVGVNPIMEGAKEVGYIITFTNNKPITIMYGKESAKEAQGVAGKDGVTPIIGIKQDVDSRYYWTIKIGDAPITWMKDASGNNICVTSDQGDSGYSPELSVAEFEESLFWQLDGKWLLSNGQKVVAAGDKRMTDNAIFAEDGIDYSTDPENVIFTLVDGTTKITLPKSSVITIGFDNYDTFYCSEIDNQVTIVLPLKLKETEYNALAATISNENGTNMDIQTRSASANTWGVEVIKPTFTPDGALVAGSAKVKLTLPQDKTNYKALLKVTLIDSKGKEYSASRIVWFKADNDVNVIDNTTGALSGKVTDPTNVKQLSIIGSVSDNDFQYIRENLTSMEVLDLSRTSITSLPVRAMAFYGDMGLTDNTILKTVILPEGLTAIGNSAFAMCKNLREMNMPKSVRTFGRWMFEGCSSLEEVKIPEGVSELPASAFYGSGIKKVTIPSSVTMIGGWAFNLCNNLTSITIPASVTSLGESVLRECASLESAEILANVDVLQNNFFMASSKLRSVKLSTSINTLNGNAFANTGLTEYTIPSHISSIKEGAFCENSKLHTVTLPAGVQTEWNVFYECKNLKNVTIPEGITELGAEMFRGCIALQSIELPSTITSIHDRAFQGCSALTLLVCKSTTPPALSGHNFGGENYNLHFFGIHPSCILKRPNGANYSAWSSKFGGGIQNL